VRDCSRALKPTARALACAANHSFDIAKSGYVNLLQPQDRRSSEPGDSRAAVEARERCLAAGLSASLEHELARITRSLPPAEPLIIADIGSGTGDLLASLARVRPIDGHGVELSSFAADRAARRVPALTWLVANADRRLPFRDQSIDLLLSIHAPRNPSEFARVLAPTGRLFVAVPAEDDLIELRAAVLGEGQRIDRVAAVLAELELHFELLERATLRERRVLARSLLLDLLAPPTAARARASPRRWPRSTSSRRRSRRNVCCSLRARDRKSERRPARRSTSLLRGARSELRTLRRLSEWTARRGSASLSRPREPHAPPTLDLRA
jgi:23S rRNA (guanine745-N1)-methyltransferase